MDVIQTYLTARFTHNIYETALELNRAIYVVDNNGIFVKDGGISVTEEKPKLYVAPLFAPENGTALPGGEKSLKGAT